MAAVAAREALAEARLQPPEFGRRLGLIFATCSGPMLLIEEHYERIVRGEPRLGGALFVNSILDRFPTNAPAGHLRDQTTVVTACSVTPAYRLATDRSAAGCSTLRSQAVRMRSPALAG
jgi:hypothetical protein